MNKSFLVAAIVTMTLGATSLASAQTPDRGVAVVDLKYIFDNFPLFLAEKKKVDAEIQAAEADVTADKNNVEGLKKSRDDCKKGTPDYNARDAQFTRAARSNRSSRHKSRARA